MKYDTVKENLEEKIKGFDQKNFNAIGLIKKLITIQKSLTVK